MTAHFVQELGGSWPPWTEGFVVRPVPNVRPAALRFDWIAVAIVLVGTIVSVDYLTHTSVWERDYDGASLK